MILLRNTPLSLALALALSAISCSSPPSNGEEESDEPIPDADDDADDDAKTTDDDDEDDEVPTKDAEPPIVRDARVALEPPRDAATSSGSDAGSNLEPGPKADAAVARIDASSEAPPVPDLFGDGGLLAPKIPGPPSPDNPKECPAVAPDNPIGSCLGVPVYATCTYGTYACICDWFHWICI